MTKEGEDVPEYFIEFSTTNSVDNPIIDVRSASMEPCLDPAKIDNTILDFTRYPMEKFEMCFEDKRFIEQENIG